MFEPIVKWSGSKRSQAEDIVARMPRVIGTYYEPFCGGCSVLYRLLNTPSVKVSRYVASDINKDLIELWTMIRDCPEELCKGYNELWETFNRHGLCPDDYERRKEVFYTVRERYNKEHSPIDFLFIMRTTTNGMPRYNDNGDFNNSCHFTRPGISPNKLRTICLEWSRILRTKNVEFITMSYDELNPDKTDLVYLDSPYAQTKGMYFGSIDLNKYFNWVGKLQCKWMMSFDGRSGDSDFTYDVPESIYVSHEYLDNGNSAFRRVIGKNIHAEVKESIYMNFVPDICTKESAFQPMLF